MGLLILAALVPVIAIDDPGSIGKDDGPCPAVLAKDMLIDGLISLE